MKKREQKNIVKITLTELNNYIASAIKENIKFQNGSVLNEGVRYDEASDRFIFDFENDKETDIIQLKKTSYKITTFNQCYYYAYEFADNVKSTSRTSFIHSIKFPDGRISESDKNTFIVNAINKLDSDISLPSYKLIVYPESLSELNRDMLGYLTRFASPDIISMELVKTLPSKIDFDYNRFNVEVLDSKLPNGRNRYTEKQKQDVLINIQSMMDKIHNLDYFSIARNVKKSKYRQFIRNYYTFKDESDRKIYEAILNTNVLIVDDIVTTGTTLSHVLNCLRSVNDTNNIVIFSLIGKRTH
jgi:hypothetical protein